MNDSKLVSGVRQILQAQNITVVDSLELPRRPAKYVPPPGGLAPIIQNYLKQLFPLGIYDHQATGIRAALEGQDVCLATPTASGKSLVFMAVSAHTIKSDNQARVLALYPAKALIQDQLAKWREFFGGLNLQVDYLDGSVPTVERSAILRRNHVVLMTPDVAHAWLLPKASEATARNFLNRLSVLVLDEAHVYDGVFGTNMAYFMRRLQAISGLQRVISSTATVGEPKHFMWQLTGRDSLVLTEAEDGSANHGKTLLGVTVAEGKAFDAYVNLISGLASADTGRFLAFADSRKMVEQLVAAACRGFATGDAHQYESDEEEDPDQESEEAGFETESPCKVLPYRAGYEEDDRRAIQRSLEKGELAGVVSTSALELGIDIGDLRIVVLLGIPPSVKSLKQRIGRAGRKSHGVCVLIDDRGLFARFPGGLKGLLERRPEPSWLYLENRYIQFANVLCAAAELEGLEVSEKGLDVFRTLPPDFSKWLRNEIKPTETVPVDLYPLKQQAQAGPHIEFPIRSGVEKSFVVRLHRGPATSALGTLTFSQTLREAYPGAIYYYMARPFRVLQYRFRDGEIRVQRSKHYTTTSNLHTMVFPNFKSGILSAHTSSEGFLAEAYLQVSERVTGFVEKRGPSRIVNNYGPGSKYSQKALNRFFETTGTCWFFSSRELASESIAAALLEGFCNLCSVQARDIGFGAFHSKGSPLGPGAVQGMCIYDTTHGSLRLTQQLSDRFIEVIDMALLIAEERGEVALQDCLAKLRACAEKLTHISPAEGGGAGVPAETEGDWVTVIAPGERVMRRALDGSSEEVEVKGARYTPHGLMYELVPKSSSSAWMVRPSDLVPMHGTTQFVRLNLSTGEQSESF